MKVTVKFLLTASVCFTMSNVLTTADDEQPPPFLVGAPKEVVENFKKLFSDGKTDSETDAAVEEWISKQSPEIKKKFNEFDSQMKQKAAEGEKAHQAALAKFSPEAKEVDVKLTAISNDKTLTAKQKQEKIEKVVSEVAPKVRDEIANAMKG